MNISDDLFRQGQIAFNGRIIADATHEIQNHFAVIKEYSGLIADLLQTKQRVINRTNKRCAQITKSINERADRAAQMVDALNGFAHRGDVSVRRFKVNEAAAELTVLLQRHAALRRVALDLDAGTETPVVTNDASVLQYLLFSLITPLLDAMEENGSIAQHISTETSGTAMINIVADGKMNGSPEQDLISSKAVDKCLEKLAAGISMNTESGDHLQILLNIPSVAVA
ncbi:MAG: hypothetical protein WC828_04240 [Thermoleophilia bacterium]|jgi:C4-dicarboxylate-specific signal transduction histidine kinase